MRYTRLSRRDVLKASAAMPISTFLAQSAKAAGPEPSVVTAALVEGARREGKVSFYTAIDLQTAERIGKAFETKYPGMTCLVERNGAERNFQRIGQEQASGIRAVDVVSSTDTSHFLHWKRKGLLAPFVPEEVARHFLREHVASDGTYATMCAWLCVIGYNTTLVKPDSAPKSFVDLLDLKWKGKLVKAHPGYSGMMVTETFILARDLGWSYFEKLARQQVMQLQSASDPPKKLQLGERAVTGDGIDYQLVLLKEKGAPVDIVYPAEGAPLIIVPSAVFANAPRPNAARLLQAFLLSEEAQRIFVDTYALRSAHSLVKEKPGRMPFSQIKLMTADPAELETAVDEVKTRYTKLFGV